MTSLSTNKSLPKGCEILIRGTVQGVGFRPFVYNLASRLGISGSVTNTGNGVRIRALGQDDRLSDFLQKLQTEAPPLARITELTQQPLSEEIVEGVFAIISSIAEGPATTAIPPDIALCSDCLSELENPQDPRYGYPFINCTNCGPRLSIIEAIPYDRPQTSMKVFPMCDLCQRQYDDPADRRFHAQPNGCPVCGPHLSWHDSDGNGLACDSPLSQAAETLRSGKVVALRGLGGFHLVVDGFSDQAVALLRERKGRPDKPLAVMMPDLTTIGTYCHLAAPAMKLLESITHPIVLLKKRSDFYLAANLAPGIAELGVMLPYTPVHHLLFKEHACPQVLVMTSGNVSGAPICTANHDAIERLAGIADNFLLHNREIVTRVDDSVARSVGETTQIFRRARGYAPTPIDIGWKLPPVIGCGAGLKNTFALAVNNSVYVSQHIGDLSTTETFDFYIESIEHLKKLLQIEPVVAVCDLHPDYLSSRYARDLGLPLYEVQHHHAHAVAVMAEHNLTEPVLAVILDGTGYGPDGTIWGGEVLLAELTAYRRLAHLQQLPLPGGDIAAEEPWRMGLAALHSLYDGKLLKAKHLPPALTTISDDKRRIITSMLDSGFNSPLSSSCGRLFDAVAAILGIRQVCSYEGQAAIELEALARRAATATWYRQVPEFADANAPSLLRNKGEKWEICSSEFVTLMLTSLADGHSVNDIALQFHLLLLGSICKLVQHLADSHSVKRIVLAGGCLQNSLLLEGFTYTLKAYGLEVFSGKMLPVNDGSISFGQTITGGLQYVSRHTHEGHPD